MAYITDLCDNDNPHGFFAPNSCLFCFCSLPFMMITAPCWSPFFMCWALYEECKSCMEWSKNKEIKKNFEEINV